MEVVTAPADAVSASPGVKMTKVDILCKMERFDALKRAMFDIGITGMTAINVMGCGEQRGKTEGYFRGARVEATMLPSIQVSIVVWQAACAPGGRDRQKSSVHRPYR